MTRNLKALGLALVASLALSAMVASAASGSAAVFTTGVGAGETAKIHGGQSVVTGDIDTINGLAISCMTATLTGNAISAGPSSTYIKVTPTYDDCHTTVPFLGTRTVTVTPNSCTYTFNATKNTNSSATGPTPGVATAFSADLHITCIPGDGIEIHIYNTAGTDDAGVTVFCTYKIDPQTIENQTQLTNEGGSPTDILAHVHANVSTTVIAGGSGGGLCGNGTLTSVTKGTDRLTATNAAGTTSVNTSVS